MRNRLPPAVANTVWVSTRSAKLAMAPHPCLATSTSGLWHSSMSGSKTLPETTISILYPSLRLKLHKVAATSRWVSSSGLGSDRQIFKYIQIFRYSDVHNFRCSFSDIVRYIYLYSYLDIQIYSDYFSNIHIIIQRFLT